ncbi:MAG TPA: DUF502 domain-containing protein [Microvirga sp.]|jgi:uncharacterized membrane protein|nr:DUF502 domain-containing protein [Microvirga sp.]
MSPAEPKPPLITAVDPTARTKTSARIRLRNYFLTGLIVAGPLTITIYITWWFITLVDGWVKPLVPARYLPETYLPFEIPGIGLVIALTGLTMLGFLTANLVGRTLLDFGEVILNRMPVVRGIYRGTKQVFETIFSTEGTSFRTVGLVEFPVKGTWSIVFISTPAGPDLQDSLPPAGEYIGVFLPCTPNPTTGFFFYLPRRDVIELTMSVDDAAKLVMSAGVIQPDETQRRLQTLAEAAKAAETNRRDERVLEPTEG